MYPENFPFRNFEWQIHTQCNYNCWYCLEENRGKPSETVEPVNKIVSYFQKCLKEPWVIQITGGEPFLNPKFIIELSKELVKMGHWIKIFTNLSADIQDYIEFIKVTEGKLYKMKASFHMNQASFEEFIEKAIKINELAKGRTKFKVFSVIQPGLENIDLLYKYSEIFHKNDIDFDVIHMVDPVTKKYHSYTTEEQEKIEHLFGKCTNELDIVSDEFQCRSGLSYFMLTSKLDAWSCWDAETRNDRTHYYGNFKKMEFAYPYSRKKCPYGECNYPNGVEEYKIK